MITKDVEYLTRLRNRFYFIHLCARFTCLKNIFILASKRTFLSSTLYHDYLLCQTKKYQSYCYSIFVLHVYSSFRAKVWALSCLSCRFCLLYLSLSIHLSFSFFSPPFLFALLAASFGGALCRMARRARTARASYENPISVRSELKAIGRYRGITCVTTECYTRKLLLSASVPEWSSFEIDVGAARAHAVYPIPSSNASDVPWLMAR